MAVCGLNEIPSFWNRIADVVKLVDTLDLGSSAERCAGSSPSIRTNVVSFKLAGPFLFVVMYKK